MGEFRISEGLDSCERFPVDGLSFDPDEENPRRGDKDAVGASLAEFSQVLPILIRSRADGLHVVGGNTTLRAAIDLGATEIAGVLAPADLSEVQIRALALALNRTSDLATYDDEILERQLAQIRETDEALFATTGYTEDDYEDLLALLDDDGHGNTLDDGKTPADREDSYRDSSTRAIMIPIPAGHYEGIVRALSELRETFEVETNAEVLIRLLEEATAKTW